MLYYIMSKLLERLKKNSTLECEIMSDSRFYGNDVFYDTGYPHLNLALSGRLNGGLSTGVTMIAAPSKHFKSNYLCICMKAFQREKPDGVILFYDTEGGTKPSYLETFGVDASRLLHIPVMNLEELKFDLAKQLNDMNAADDIFVAVDSLGNIASKKEVVDAQTGNEAADMTRAKQMKSLGRIITPYINKFKISFVGIGHTYQTQDRFPTTVMSGGTGVMYISDTVLLVGKSQEKTGKVLDGFDFKLNIDKSRFIKEKLTIPFPVMYSGGPDKYGALFDLCMAHTDIIEQKGAWYVYPESDKNKRKSEIVQDTKWMDSLLENDEFVDAVEGYYRLPDPIDTSQPYVAHEEDPDEVDFEAMVAENSGE